MQGTDHLNYCELFNEKIEKNLIFVNTEKQEGMKNKTFVFYKAFSPFFNKVLSQFFNPFSFSFNALFLISFY